MLTVALADSSYVFPLDITLTLLLTYPNNI